MSETNRSSVQRRVIELLQRQLPEGWSCNVDGNGLELSHQDENRILSLEPLYSRVEQQPEKRRESIYAFVSQVMAFVRGKSVNRDLTGREQDVYPLLRHVSFAPSTATLVVQSHTEETIITYALDHGEGYSLIDETMLSEADWTLDKLHQCSLENLKRLPFSVRSQQVGTTIIHFVSPKDGYAASRLLLGSLLDEYEQTKKGKALGVAIPHQDVLIIADLHDDEGAHLLARLTYDFASKGETPISLLPFFYEQGKLESFIVVKQGDQLKAKHKRKG